LRNTHYVRFFVEVRAKFALLVFQRRQNYVLVGVVSGGQNPYYITRGPDPSKSTPAIWSTFGNEYIELLVHTATVQVLFHTDEVPYTNNTGKQQEHQHATDFI
jgi:hypothetical protein